ncbi:MAG: hypothetical protein MUO29_01355, partial [Desulfobacterales bacterium]|nr:hypothetical protein [Desulfobacterales bacterium]
MLKKIFLTCLGLALLALLAVQPGVAQEDRFAQVAIDTIKAQMRLPKDVEIKFVERQESSIPDFYSVKLLLLTPDREMPVLVYVDKTGEKVIVGNLYVKG